MSLNVKFSIPTKKSPKFFSFLRFLDQSSCITSYKMRFLWSSDRLEPELRYRCCWGKLVTVADFKRHKRQKMRWYPKTFLMVFRDETMDYKGEFKIGVVAFWQGEIFDLKVVKLDESQSLKTPSFIFLCWLTSRRSNWLILALDIN